MPPDPPSRSTATRRDKVTDRLPPPAAPGSSQARSGGITSILPRHIYTYVPTMYVACVEAMRGTRLAAWLPVRGETCRGLYYVCSNMGHADPQTHKSGTIHTPLPGIGNGARGERQEGGHSAQQAQRCCPAIFLFSVTDVETESFPVGPTHLVFYVFKLNQCRMQTTCLTCGDN